MNPIIQHLDEHRKWRLTWQHGWGCQPINATSMGSMELACHGCATTLSEICSTQIMFKQCNSTILLRVRATQIKDATLPIRMVNNTYKYNPTTLELSTTNKIEYWFNHSGWLNMKGIKMDNITFCGLTKKQTNQE